jgi:hypothetical protein
MRRMFHDGGDPLAELVMWFDDDTYLDEKANLLAWWQDIEQLMNLHHMIGQHWFLAMQGQQWDWIKTQPWYNPEAGLPTMLKGRRRFQFCQGAWWVIRREAIRDLNWPPPELKHNGGDSLLGEAVRQQGWSMGRYSRWLHINADARGRDSQAVRRGFSEPVIGKHYKGQPLPTDHQNFPMEKYVFGPRHVPASLPKIEMKELPCW